jgi:hypothetical protein
MVVCNCRALLFNATIRKAQVLAHLGFSFVPDIVAQKTFIAKHIFLALQ